MLREVDLGNFPGLDLRDESGMLGALDIADVRWGNDQSIASRSGSEIWSDSVTGIANAAFAASTVYAGGAKRIILSSTTDASQVIDGATGAVLQTNLAGVKNVEGFRDAARFSTPGAEGLIICAIRADGTVSDGVFLCTLAGNIVFSTPWEHIDPITGATTVADEPAWSQVAAWSGQERLVGGGNGSARPVWAGFAINVDPSMVFVSEPSKPYSYKTTSFVRLGLGDGERVTQIIAWRDLVFCFKNSRFWVFTGVNVESDGTVRIQKRAIDTGVGCVGNFAAAAAPEGVYFVSQRGIYLTNGGEPVCISDPIAPLFGVPERIPPWYTGGNVDMSGVALRDARLAWVYDTLYFTFQTSLVSSTYETLAYHAPTKRWSRYTVPARFIFSHDSRGMQEPHYCPESAAASVPTTRGVNRIRPGLPGDACSTRAMTPFYRGPFLNLAKGRVVRVRDLRLWGGGTIDVGLGTDLSTADARREQLLLTAALPGTTRQARIARVNQWRASHASLYVGFTPPNKAGEKAWSVTKAIAGIGASRHHSQPDADG